MVRLKVYFAKNFEGRNVGEVVLVVFGGLYVEESTKKYNSWKLVIYLRDFCLAVPILIRHGDEEPARK